ncbi:MAG TPA: bifunctional phosphoribosylaminoimidazolecarboxamide formyltransferase/IMP cyclohydrolase [Chloroflexota bacterium]|nr:bifunctional phosphoribosylaminoimidazolecarboxamide formyltransferase/IMP cyclohydrolase [Chloroflexota bacterium]
MRAILSVYDKTGLVDFARGLNELGIELYSTGGTEELLRQAGVAVRPVEELTGFAAILGGRVKTLHPAIHAGILARRDHPGHMAELEQLAIAPIDLVVVNLYPFAEKVAQPDITLDEALEHIDIGGSALLRGAAKNYPAVVVVCDPADYQDVLDALRRPGGVSMDLRRRLAAKAFQHTAFYDTLVANYLRPHDELFPQEMTLALRKIMPLRYGENPHQLAAFYADATIQKLPYGIVGGQQLHGKQLSFNNTYDLDAAWRIVSDFAAPTVAIVKHGNPCGLAAGDDLAETYRRALACDPQSAFGGAVGTNREVDAALAEEIAKVFFEDLIAPSYTEEALAILRRKKDLRVFATGGIQMPSGPGQQGVYDLDYKRVVGGFLVQTRDALPESALTRDVVTERHPTLEELTSLLFAWRAVKHVRSNAIVLAKKLALVGVGAGQMSRVDSVDLAIRKAGDRAAGSVMASDAFFPFPDSIEHAAEAGVTAVIQPGGSIRDAEVIKAANRHRMAMIFTHQRHFLH